MKKIKQRLHFIWIGDESKCPNNCINTWSEKNPDFEIVVWGNKEFEERNWANKKHMMAVMATGQLCGVADMMRWEILAEQGGFVVDADSVCLNPIPEWFLNCDLLVSWENEMIRPGLLCSNFVAAKPSNPVILSLIERIKAQKNIATRFIWYKVKRKRLSAWRTTGPKALTKALFESSYNSVTILPSHFFNPIHPGGFIYQGAGPIICSQLFAGTQSSQFNHRWVHEIPTSELIDKIKSQLNRAAGW